MTFCKGLTFAAKVRPLQSLRGVVVNNIVDKWVIAVENLLKTCANLCLNPV